jgi:hypothetical protein
MKTFKPVLGVLCAAIWISVSEFVRNSLLLKSLWVAHYQGLGLTFPSDPVNGAIWGLWSLIFAAVTYALAQRFSLLHTAALSWVVGFLMMWVVIGNLGVLPLGILPYAVPLSLLEAFVATVIVRRFSEK